MVQIKDTKKRLDYCRGQSSNIMGDESVASTFPFSEVIDVRTYYAEIWSRSFVFDYNPADFYGPEIGSHWKILQLKNDATPPVKYPQYLSHWLEIGQEQMMGPGHVEVDEYYPMQGHLATQFIGLYNAEKEREQKKYDEKKSKHTSNPIIHMSNWFTEIDGLLDENFLYPKDVKNDIEEMIQCIRSKSFRAGLAMAGRVLEQILNQLVLNHDLDINQDLMMGRKIGALREGGVYLDPTLGNIVNVINTQRISGVHVKESIKIPSEDDMNMVMFAVKSALGRLIEKKV